MSEAQNATAPSPEPKAPEHKPQPQPSKPQAKPAQIQNPSYANRVAELKACLTKVHEKLQDVASYLHPSRVKEVESLCEMIYTELRK